jgi:hypothetical protein
MRSKWLSWQPGSVGFVGSSMGEDSIIRPRSDTENGTSYPFNPSIILRMPHRTYLQNLQNLTRRILTILNWLAKPCCGSERFALLGL